MAAVDLIWRLASEGGTGNNGIVLVDVECDQYLQRRESVELVPKHSVRIMREPAEPALGRGSERTLLPSAFHHARIGTYLRIPGWRGRFS